MNRREFLGLCAGLGLELAACSDRRSGRGAGHGKKRQLGEEGGGPRRMDDSLVANPALVGEYRWKGAGFDEAGTRIRVASVLQGREEASWEVLDASNGRRLAGESVAAWKDVALGWASAPLCVYAALRTNHLRPAEPLVCHGDRSQPDGHGKLTVVQALAQGCRSFVQQVATRITWADYELAVRLFGMSDALGPRPPDQMERWRMMAEGVGVRLSSSQARRFTLHLSKPDPGDRARSIVRLGALQAVRTGYAQAAGVAGLDISLVGGSCGPGSNEVMLLAWSPFRRPRFAVVVHHRGGLPSGLDVTRRVFSVLAG